MNKSRTYIFFIIGLGYTLILSIIYFFFLPDYEFYKEKGWVYYGPTNKLDELVKNVSLPTNISLLIKYTKYSIIYWISFSVIYFILERIRNQNKWCIYGIIHFILSIIGITILIYLNIFLIDPFAAASKHFVSIVFISEITKDNIFEVYDSMLWYYSNKIFTSKLGISLCLIGVVIFIIGLIRELKTSAR